MAANGADKSDWYNITNHGEVTSPSLLVYPERIENNILKMKSIAGNNNLLRPHVKSHKMAEVVRLQMEHGITRFKCATIAEAEMVAGCGTTDVLLAMQPVGPNQQRLIALIKRFPGARFSCIADSSEIIAQLSALAVDSDVNIPVWIDINCGMNRTGIAPGTKAADLYLQVRNLPNLVAAGLHVYDGHIHEHDFDLRKEICNAAFIPVKKRADSLEENSGEKVKIVAGGTPTFPVHAMREGIELSPGTLLLWDHGYGTSFKDLDFQNTAVLFTRIVSKPDRNLLCLDLGHKAVASEMPQPRVLILGISDYSIVGHNEEHMVVKTPEAEMFRTGDHLYCIPWHICPTVDRHDVVNVVTGNKVTGQWNVEARKRKITI
jgi:D-serine deaminase-like pyridoxal phosphate-dependent protein